MSRYHILPLPAVFVLLGLLSCSDDGKPSSPTPQPGRITVRVESIPGQSGKVCAVMAYGFDWQPGAQEPFIASIGTPIAEESFSFSGTLQSLNESGQPTGQAKLFDPGVYSVVFFIAAPDGPPSAFAEVRASVNGDITVTAPAWAGWQHP